MKPVDQQLFRALKQGHPTAVQHALMDGANPNSFSPKEKMSAIQFACSINISEPVRILAKAGADANQMIDGKPLLSWASGQGFDQAVHCLLDGFSDFGIKDADGNNALHDAIASGNRIVAKMLGRAGVDPDEQNNAGVSPRDMAIRMKRNDLVSVLPEITHEVEMPGRS